MSTALLGAGQHPLLAAAEQVGTPPRARDELFRLDTDNLWNGWEPRTHQTMRRKHQLSPQWYEEPDASWGGPNGDANGLSTHVLVGGGIKGSVLRAHDYRSMATWYRDDLFALDDADIRKGWAPRTWILGQGLLGEGQWWEEPDLSLGFHGPNYAPNAETLRGPSWSRTLSAAAALAIYDSP